MGGSVGFVPWQYEHLKFIVYVVFCIARELICNLHIITKLYLCSSLFPCRDSDGDSVDSAEFFDTVARKPVTRVKLGESKRGTLNSSISGSRYVG